MINPICLSIFGFTLFYWSCLLARCDNHVRSEVTSSPGCKMLEFVFDLEDVTDNE